MTDTIDIEIDDFPGGSAVYEYDAEWQPEERDIGVHAGWNITGEIISAKIGALHLTRDQLVQAMTFDKWVGEAEVAKLEALAMEQARLAADGAAEASDLDHGDWLHDRRRDDALTGWAAE